MIDNINATVTADPEQQLFVIPTGHGFTCLGFQVCETRRERYAKWLGIPLPTARLGTLDQYASYRQLVAKCCAGPNRCTADLCPQLIGLEGRRVEVVTHYGERRRFWVGKSAGPIPVHLEIARRTSHGGTAVSYEGYQSVRVVR